MTFLGPDLDGGRGCRVMNRPLDDDDDDDVDDDQVGIGRADMISLIFYEFFFSSTGPATSPSSISRPLFSCIRLDASRPAIIGIVPF